MLVALQAALRSSSWSFPSSCSTAGTRTRRRDSFQRPNQSHGLCYWRERISTTITATRVKPLMRQRRFLPVSVASRVQFPTFRAAAASIRAPACFGLGLQIRAPFSTRVVSGRPPAIAVGWLIPSLRARISTCLASLTM